MKPLHLTAYFFPQYSGTTTRLYNLLCRLPYEILLFTSDRTINGGFIPQKREQIGNIKVKRFPTILNTSLASIPAIRYLHTIYTYYHKPKLLIKASQDEKWDVIHVHNVLPFGKAAKKLANAYRTPLVFELHGIAKDSLTGNGKLIASVYLKKETQSLIRYSGRVITLTQSQKDRVCEFYKVPPEKVAVVPNGADMDIFTPRKEYRIEAENLRERLCIDDKIVMYAGCMDYINGMDDLCKIIPVIIQEKPNISFVFIGQGPSQGKLLSLSETYPKNIKFLGPISYNKMPVYYQMCDVFVIPRPSTISSEIITPLKLLEVMAMEKPVLGSNVGGITEVITGAEKNGYLFEKGNTESFKKTLWEVLDMDNTQIGKNARKTVADNYTWDKSTKILQEIYEDLV